MAEPSHPKLRVLVLDDSDVVRLILQQLLTRKGFEVITYPKPADCPLLHAERCRCTAVHVCADVVVTDLEMPEVTGLEFIAALVRKGCKIGHIAILSGNPHCAALARAAGLDCKTFVKPEGIQPMLAWLDEVAAALPLNRQLQLSLPGPTAEHG